MSTKSFTREIRVTEPTAIKKIHEAMNRTSTDKVISTIKDIDQLISANRKILASKLTKKF
jgi:hypothetical protein